MCHGPEVLLHCSDCKYINRAYILPSVLYKMKVRSDSYLFDKFTIGSYLHMIWECLLLVHFWKYVCIRFLTFGYTTRSSTSPVGWFHSTAECSSTKGHYEQQVLLPKILFWSYGASHPLRLSYFKDIILLEAPLSGSVVQRTTLFIAGQTFLWYS